MATCADPEGGPALSRGQTVSKGLSGLCCEGQHKAAIGRSMVSSLFC